MATIGVIGAGAFGTSLAIHACKLGHQTRIWAYEPEVAEQINEEHENEVFLPGVGLPPNLTADNDLAAVCAGAELLLLATPTSRLRAVAARAAPHIDPAAVVCIVSKGLETGTLKLMSEVAAEAAPQLDPENLCVLSGPSFAAEVAEGLPTDVVVASRGFTAARRIQPLLHSPLFRVYGSDDLVGVQIGGAMKNVIAIAAGVCDEYGLGCNARAALITRGLTEITRLGLVKGANPITFLGLAGLGDLVLTCTCDLSRNRTLGRRIARGEKPADILASTRTVAEGFYAADAAWQMARDLGVDMPITEQVHAVLHEGKTIPDAARDLMSREFKDEFKGIIHR
jgi:glycerol-3-phosphate dehydrogenase (NAD(P)+)